MPHEYVDNEDRPPPFNENVVFEQGVDASGGYTVPVPADYTLRGYKSTAVRVDGHGSIITVEVGWTHSGDSSPIVTIEEKTQLTSDPCVLLFVNQGDVLEHVTLSGGGDVDYSVVESNQLPLPKLEQPILGLFYNLGGEPGIVDPVPFVGSDVYNSPNWQRCEVFTCDTTDTSVFEVDAVNHSALIKKQGLYVVYGSLLQADRPLAPFDTGVPIQGIFSMGWVDGLGGGGAPGFSPTHCHPGLQGYLDGAARNLSFIGFLNTYVYHEDSSGFDFLPVAVDMYYAPGMATSISPSNFQMNIWRLADGDINLFL